jgi:hypothetical protein
MTSLKPIENNWLPRLKLYQAVCQKDEDIVCGARHDELESTDSKVGPDSFHLVRRGALVPIKMADQVETQDGAARGQDQ